METVFETNDKPEFIFTNRNGVDTVQFNEAFAVNGHRPGHQSLQLMSSHVKPAFSNIGKSLTVKYK